MGMGKLVSLNKFLCRFLARKEPPCNGDLHTIVWVKVVSVGTCENTVYFFH